MKLEYEARMREFQKRLDAKQKNWKKLEPQVADFSDEILPYLFLADYLAA